MQVYQFPLCSTYTSYLEAIEQQGLKDTDTSAPELSFGDPYSALEDSFAFTSALATELTTRELIKLRDCRAIITPSVHSHTVLSASRLGVPIARVRYGVDTAKYALRSVSPKCCTFGFVNAEGIRSEENVKLVIDAFSRAFSGVQNVRLQIRRSNYIAPDIRISVGGAPDSEWYPWLTALIVVPQARGVSDEALKAMARGVPVIASNYGFSAEYYDSLHCYPLDWELKEQPDGYWAETCVEALAVQMRAVYDDQEQAEAKGLLASEAMQVFDWKYVLPESVSTLQRLNFWPKAPATKMSHFWIPNINVVQADTDAYNVAEEVERYATLRPDPPVSDYSEIRSYGTVVTAGYEQEALIAIKSLSLYTDKPIFAICDAPSAEYLKKKGSRAFCFVGITSELINEYYCRFFKNIERYSHSGNYYPASAYACMLKKMDTLYIGIKHYGNCLLFDSDFVFTGAYEGNIKLSPLVLAKHHWKGSTFDVRRKEAFSGKYNTGHVFCSDSDFSYAWAECYLKNGKFIDQDCLDDLPVTTPTFGERIGVGFWNFEDIVVTEGIDPDWRDIARKLGIESLSSNSPTLSYHGHLFRDRHRRSSSRFQKYVRWELSVSLDIKHSKIISYINLEEK